MHRHSKEFIAALIAACIISGIALIPNLFVKTAFGQSVSSTGAAAPEPSAEDSETIFKADTRLVVVHASVVDKNGKLVTNLAEPAFKIQENGVDQAIKIFRREDIPVSMGIIIDNSGSMRDKAAKVAAAALDLIRASNPQDEIFVVNFNDDYYLDQGFTNDIKKLESALEHYQTRGGTAMRDALSASMDYVKDKAKKDKKVLVVVTDGNDNTSSLSLEELVRKAQQSGVLIYSIGILSEEEPREGKKAQRALKELATATGGLTYYPKDLAEVDKITPEVAHEIRNQYTIAYTPTNEALDGTFRRINVTVNAPGKPTVRTRNGYYATAAGK